MVAMQASAIRTMDINNEHLYSSRTVAEVKEGKNTPDSKRTNSNVT